MCAPRASASTSSGCAYSRSILSRTRRSRARSLRRCASASARIHEGRHMRELLSSMSHVAVDGGGVGHLKGDGFDGSHGDQARCGSVTRASRFLIGLVVTFVTSRPRQSARNRGDRKSTRLNSSHDQISYAVFCLKKKKK